MEKLFFVVTFVALFASFAFANVMEDEELQTDPVPAA